MFCIITGRENIDRRDISVLQIDQLTEAAPGFKSHVLPDCIILITARDRQLGLNRGNARNRSRGSVAEAVCRRAHINSHNFAVRDRARRKG